MSIKPSISNKFDLVDQQIKEFFQDASPVMEDVLEQERKKREEQKKKEEPCIMISMRLEKKMLDDLDRRAQKRYMKRAAWIKEAIREKLSREKNV